MKKANMPMLAALASAVIIGGIFIGIFMSSRTYSAGKTEIILPKDVKNNEVIVGNENHIPNVEVYNDISINKTNVIDIIKSMKRPKAYTQKISNTVFHEGDRSTFYCIQMLKDGFSKNEYINEDGETQKYLILGDGFYYGWRYNSLIYSKGSLGDVSFDEEAMLPTYEDVIALSQDNISEVSMQNINYEPCIVISVKKDDVYSYTYCISTTSGLLVMADFYKNNEVIRQIKVEEMDFNTPLGENFVLPDGTSVFDA